VEDSRKGGTRPTTTAHTLVDKLERHRDAAFTAVARLADAKTRQHKGALRNAQQ
jgi:hypothetical protein